MASRQTRSLWDLLADLFKPAKKRRRAAPGGRLKKSWGPEDAAADTQQVAQELAGVARDVLENSTLTNARQLTAALRGGRSSGATVTTTTSTTVQPAAQPPGAAGQPAGDPAGTPPPDRYRLHYPGSPDQFGQVNGQYTYRGRKWGTVAPPVVLPPGGAGGAGGAGGPAQPLPPQAHQFTGWLGKIVALFQQWHAAAGGGHGHSGGLLGALMGGDWRRHHPGFAQVAGGLFSGGLGQGGAGLANSMGGAALNAGLGGMSRLGGALSGAGGAAGTVGGGLAMGASLVGGAIGLAAAFAGLCRISYMLADAQMESMRAFAQFNATIANSFIQSDFQDRLRMFDQAAINASSTQALVESMDLLKDDLMPLRALMTDALNYIGTGIAITLRGIYRAVVKGVPGLAAIERAIKAQAEAEQKKGRHALAGHFGDVISGKIYNQKPGQPGKHP